MPKGRGDLIQESWRLFYVQRGARTLARFWGGTAEVAFPGSCLDQQRELELNFRDGKGWVTVRSMGWGMTKLDDDHHGSSTTRLGSGLYLDFFLKHANPEPWTSQGSSQKPSPATRELIWLWVQPLGFQPLHSPPSGDFKSQGLLPPPGQALTLWHVMNRETLKKEFGHSSSML